MAQREMQMPPEDVSLSDLLKTEVNFIYHPPHSCVTTYERLTL